MSVSSFHLNHSPFARDPSDLIAALNADSRFGAGKQGGIVVNQKAVAELQCGGLIPVGISDEDVARLDSVGKTFGIERCLSPQIITQGFDVVRLFQRDSRAEDFLHFL